VRSTWTPGRLAVALTAAGAAAEAVLLAPDASDADRLRACHAVAAAHAAALRLAAAAPGTLAPDEAAAFVRAVEAALGDPAALELPRPALARMADALAALPQ
jgi:hypothetical protein